MILMQFRGWRAGLIRLLMFLSLFLMFFAHSMPECVVVLV